MTQPLNYVPKAIEAFEAINKTAMPFGAAGCRYLADKMRQAQVFVLPDHGELLDRSKPMPEVAGATFHPPFPIVALEYAAPPKTGRVTPGYSDAPCSRRISLAWEWQDDLPPELRPFSVKLPKGSGVVVASIAYFDEPRMWLPVSAAAHLDYDEPWRAPEPSPHVEAMVASGQMSKAQASARRTPMTIVPILPEGLAAIGAQRGQAGLIDAISADLMDEVGAYTDLCCALACGNVGTELHKAPAALNKARARAGKPPLFDFHVLKLLGAEGEGGLGGSADKNAPRAHLRRGHIRRLHHLGPDRITWVNAAMVRGRGFVDKVYSA